MTRYPLFAGRAAQSGYVLIASLLILIVMTLFALSMFRSMGVQEVVAGNVRDKQRSIQAAVDAEQYAEFWLSSGVNAAANEVTCAPPKVNANTATVQVCSNDLATTVANIASVPWKVSGNEIGYTYNPGTDMTTSTSGAPGAGLSNGATTFYDVPRFYISDLGISATGANSEIYRIDAWGYGSNQSTVSVVEAIYQVTATARTPDGG